MSSVTADLVLISQDARSEEATYEFRLRNHGEQSITVKLDVLLPKWTSLQRERSERQQRKHEVRQQCARLEGLLRKFHAAWRKENKVSGVRLGLGDLGYRLSSYGVAGGDAVFAVLGALAVLVMRPKGEVVGDLRGQGHWLEPFTNLQVTIPVLVLAAVFYRNVGQRAVLQGGGEGPCGRVAGPDRVLSGSVLLLDVLP